MALGRSLTTALMGVEATLVRVEVNIGNGLPGTYIVGLADAAISESRDRIKTAIINSGLQWPRSKIIINLSPASLRKSGSHSDLAMAVAVLVAQTKDTELNRKAESTLFLGEIALDGSILPITGVIPALLAARNSGITTVIIPQENSAEASLMDSPHILPVRHLKQVYSWLGGNTDIHPVLPNVIAPKRALDMKDVVGQRQARFAAEVAAAGGHHMLLVGPPGSGKSMIAARLPGLLPELNNNHRIEATAVHSVAGRTFNGPVTQAPFVAPHHSITKAALLGGGVGSPKPGAVSLAHRGVLFLEEVSEIPAATLDLLRTPLECGYVRLLRAQQEYSFPASFQLVLAANPCRCGAEQVQQCRCSSNLRANYLSSLSGPLRDRIDIMTATHAAGAIMSQPDAESTKEIAERVAAARDRAAHRWRKYGLEEITNAAIDPHRLRKEFPADEEAMAYIGAFLAHGTISHRGVDRALKLAWSLCDLSEKKKPNIDHVAQALELRSSSFMEAAA